MAHKGKAWPLMFRRDINLNVTTYKFGFAEQYDVTPLSLLGSLGTFLNSKPWRCSNPVVDSSGTTEWKSAPIILGAHTYTVVLIEEIRTVVQQLNQCRYEVREGAVIRFARQYFSAAHPIAQGGDISPFGSTTVSTPPIIYDTGASGCQMRPVQW